MKEFIFSVRNRVHIIDFRRIFEYSKNVFDQVRELSVQGCNILFVGRKKQVSELMKNGAVECNCPYMTRR